MKLSSLLYQITYLFMIKLRYISLRFRQCWRGCRGRDRRV